MQLKSSLDVDSSKDTVAFSLETDKLQYYMQRDTPVLLVLVDLKTKNCSSLFIQEYVYEKLDTAKPLWRQQKTVALDIPTENMWTNWIHRAKEIAFTGQFYLMIKKLSSTDTETMLKWKTNLDSIKVLEEFSKSLTITASQMELDLAARYDTEGEQEQSLQKLLSVYKKLDADPKQRLSALESLVWYYNPTSKDENRTLFELSMQGLKLADAVGDRLHSQYFRGISMQAVYFKMVNDLTNEMLLQKLSYASKSVFEFFTITSIRDTSLKLAVLGQDFVTNLRTVEQERYYGASADLLRRYGLMMLYLYQCYVVWIQANHIDDLLKSAENSLDLALKMCQHANWSILECMVLDGMATLYHFKNDINNRRSVLNRFQEIAKRLGHKGLTKQAEKKWQFYEASGRFITGPSDIPPSREEDFEKRSEEEMDRMHRRLLEAGGIDVNGDGELSGLARIGLKDRNPERVLKHCEHLHVEVVNYGPVWDMVGLPTTGTKLLYCDLKDTFLTGWTLDGIFHEFEGTYCSKCNSCSPRAADWKWSYRWQREREQPDKMKAILKKVRGFG